MNAPGGVDGPLSLGEIVDRGVTIVVRRWRTLAVLVLLEAVPIGIARVVSGPAPAANIWWFVPDLLIVPWLVCAAVLTAASPEPPSVASVLRRSVARYGACLVAQLLSFVLLVILVVPVLVAGLIGGVPFDAVGQQTLAFVAAGILGGIVALLIGPRLYLVASLLYPIVVLEGASPSKAWSIAFRRTRNAGWGRAWRFGLTLIALGLAPAVILSSGVDRLIDLTHVAAFRFADELLSDAITVGLGTVVATVMSLEMRVRYEGADLEAEIATSGSGYQENGAASSAVVSSAGSE